jgi:hypothetical protein
MLRDQRERVHDSWHRLISALMALACGLLAARAAADLLPLSPLPPGRSLWVNLEILPAEPTKPLPQPLRDIESGRLQAEEAVVNGRNYRKTSLILPLANGDRREVILLLAEEEGRMRMLGFHRIHRHLDTPQGTTIVFQSGVPNPLSGEPATVPPDTYTYLALCTALSGFGADRAPLPVHLWQQGGAVQGEVAFDGKESIEVLGTRVAALRVRVRPKNASGSATYWFTEAQPYTLLQYRGPGDFLAPAGEAAPEVLLRATASSEQVRKIFQN